MSPGVGEAVEAEAVAEVGEPVEDITSIPVCFSQVPEAV